MAHGSSPLASDHYGWTPLHYAMERGNGRLAEIFLNAGASIGALNKEGLSPVDLARGNGLQDFADRMVALDESIKLNQVAAVPQVLGSGRRRI